MKITKLIINFQHLPFSWEISHAIVPSSNQIFLGRKLFPNVIILNGNERSDISLVSKVGWFMKVHVLIQSLHCCKKIHKSKDYYRLGVCEFF